MDPHHNHQQNWYLVLDPSSKQLYTSRYNYNPVALPNQQLIKNPDHLSPPARPSYTFNQQQIQLSLQQWQSQQSFVQRRSRLPTILDSAPVTFQHARFLHPPLPPPPPQPQPQPRDAMNIIPCRASKRIRIEEVAYQQIPSNGSSVSNNNLPARAKARRPVRKEGKVKQSTQPVIVIDLENEDGTTGQYKAGFPCEEVEAGRKATRGKQCKSSSWEEERMDMSVDVDTELRL